MSILKSSMNFPNMMIVTDWKKLKVGVARPCSLPMGLVLRRDETYPTYRQQVALFTRGNVLGSPLKSSGEIPSQVNMSALSTDKKPLVDYGVQIRFINDLHDTGGGIPEKSRAAAAATPPSNKYGVAVRVQGISGQPYLVLKDGEKGDSYGVQLKAQAMPQSPSLSPVPGSRYNSSGRDPKPPGFPKPYAPVGNTRSSSVSPAEEVEGEVFGSPLKRPPGDGQAVGQVGDGERGAAPKADPLPNTVTSGGTGKRPEWDSGDEFNEAGLKPVKRNGVGTRSVKQNGFTSAGSLGRHSGKTIMQNFPLESFPEGLPPPPSPSSSSSARAEEEEEERAPAIDTESLAPINKLISKFNSSGPGGCPQTRGRAGARQRLRFDERRRSRSLDARKEAVVALPLPASPTFDAVNPYASTPTPRSAPSKTSASPGSASVGPGTSGASVTTAMAFPTSRPGFKSSRSSVAKDTPHPAIPKKPETPAPLRHQSRSLDVSSDEDEQAKQAIYNILKDGSSASEASIKRKVNLIYAKTNPLKFRGSMGNPNKDGDEHLNEAKELREQLNRLKAELREAHDELAEGRMAREASESTVRQQEDQLAALQEELRRISEGSPYSDSVQTDVATLQAELVEAAMLRQRQEETLHQRERELTALKGALKEEVESHDEEVENLREQYSQDMEVLRRTMEEVSQSQEDIEEERQRVNASMVSLGDELDSCRDQGDSWKTQLEATQLELQRCRRGREGLEGELRELQDSVSSMKNQTPGVDDGRFEAAQRCHDDLKRTRAELDKQKAELEQKCAELQALRKAGEGAEAGLRSEMSRLRDQSQSDKAELEKAKESLAGSSARPVLEQESAQELQEANARLRERLSRMTTRRSSTLPLSPGAEEALEVLEDENRALKTQLEEARRGAARLGKEKEELGRRLEERDQEREALRRGKTELEEQKRLLDRALDKINKEMESMMGDSRQSVMGLQTQLEEYRDRSRKELLEAQRSSKDRLAELQRSQTSLKAQQDEVSRLKKDLLAAGEERDGAQLERDLLNGRLKHMEEELEAERSTYTDRSREVRSLEDKLKSLGIELDEEKSNVELLNDRIARSREQVEQLRSELMQERSARHDLEMDKSSMERQLKELKSRVVEMETPSRPSAGLAVLEKKVLELEETLLSEEREKVTIMASQRRMERRLKDLNATLDQERNQSAEQKDQLSLRVKALKRQVDESECEVERLEGVRRKGLRELEEQQEQREALQAKVTALEAELKRKVQHSRTLALSSVNLSSEDEDLLTEIHLQNNN
ncbi:cingulin isoform X2 [Gadus chalcogrammus]|uniref:cingulin isoform X2 n=1 Tax=Gadus chalcogrammus TaxID=1042646 RepID=UPI0024C4C1B8|nr:cingulin isoform X2 [Gadus chalcogrammus]